MRLPLRGVNKDENVSLMSEIRTRPAAPRQKRAVATRTRLLDTVERIVTAENADAVTTTRVASDAAVSVGTIYRYFEDRDAMLLAAYDATVGRIVACCRESLELLGSDLRIEEAAQTLLDRYLEAADAIPAHAGLLAEMRRLRSVEIDQSSNEDRITTELIEPFLARFVSDMAPDPMRMHVMSILIGTLVDMYLVTPDPEDRAALRAETSAHLLFMLGRLAPDRSGP